MSAFRRYLTGTALLALAAACTRAPAPEATPAPATPPIQVVVDTPRAPAFDRTKPPPLAPLGQLTLPPVTRRELDNGLELLVVEHHELPVVDMILVVKTGGEGDPAGKPGVATLTASMLDEGAGRRTALDIADQEAFLGVQVGTGSGWDQSMVTLHAPVAVLDSAMALFADVALRPTFPTADLERLRKERLTELLQLRDRAPQIADRAYAAILYGERHPYGRPLTGTEASTRAITRADVRRFYQTYFRPNNATLIVVGDVTAADVEQRARALFANWERGTVPATEFKEPPAALATAIYLIDKPGAPQSSVRIGSIGVPRSTEDYFSILVMNTILGGAFTSRLNNNLRETHGYTYGAGSGFSMRRAAGPFTARAEVVGAKSDSSLIEFMKELKAIRDAVPDAELEKAKRYLQLQLPGEFETTGDIASQLVPVVVHGLPLDYYNSYVQRIESVTVADVQRVAQRYIDPSKFAVVVVGDRKAIEAGLRALNLGELSIRDIAGQPVRR
ncbi:MAG TPA: pitrilysin family protein [Gemmatimonadaceae bacterium]|nr:pitrilysin family protein [Gemmatimonadaceae bacterium]